MDETGELTELQLTVLKVLWKDGEATAAQVRRAQVDRVLHSLFRGARAALIRYLYEPADG